MAERDGDDVRARSVRNELSGTAHNALQAGYVGYSDQSTNVQSVIINLPEVPPPVPQATPHEVRDEDPHFTNRAPEVSRLTAWTTSESAVRMAVITGRAGSGKTALARRQSHLTLGRFTGGELLADYTDSPSPFEVIGRFLQALGVDHRALPTTLPAREAMYRTWTAAKPVLVVVDGASEPGQVRSLIPSARGSVVLVTSNHRLGELVDEDGAELLMLESLEPSHARDLLGRICGTDRLDTEPEAVEELVRVCDGLPLALRKAAARLRQEPALTIRELLEEIEEDLGALSVGGTNGLDAVFTAHWRGLPAVEQRAYLLLGACEERTFTDTTLAALLDVPTPRARSVLRSLARANILVDLPQRRYRFPELIRRHAADLVGQQPPPDLAGALDRRLRACLTTGAFADMATLHPTRLRLYLIKKLTSGRTDPFAGVASAAQAWISGQWPNLLAILVAAVRRGAYDDAWQFAEVLAALSLNQRRTADRIKICELGIDAASACDRRDVRARLYALASRGYLDLGHRSEARAALVAALRDAKAVGRPDLLASVWEFCGRYFEVIANLEAAARAYRMAVALNDSVGDRRGTAIATLFLAGVLDDTRQHTEAREQLVWVVQEFHGLHDERMEARARLRLGVLDLRQDDHAAATEALLSAVQVFATRDTTHYEMQALTPLVAAAVGIGDLAGAREALKRLLALYEAADDPRADDVRQQLAELR